MINNWEFWAFVFGIGDLFLLCVIFAHRDKKMRPKLIFTFLNLKHNKMLIIPSLTLTSRTPVTVQVVVIDENNNNAIIPGVLSNLSVVSGDANEDTVTTNATNAEAVDIAAVAAIGGTTVTATGSFTSTALNPDGTPEVSGTLTGVLTLLNNIVIKAALAFSQN